MSDDSDSPLSSVPSGDEMEMLSSLSRSPSQTPSDIAAPIPNSSSPSRDTKREPSPPHLDVLADNPDIAFIVMFRSRFSDAFPQKLFNFGPQDVERGVVDPLPSPQVESLLCALLALVLNRKKPIERGHYGRALEEAISTQKSQWPRVWQSISPISGGRTFNSMSPQERLTLLRALILWSLHSSEAISAIIKDSYKQSRNDDDLNQPLSVQPWGRDGNKRRYWLVEGRDDTPFRLYRESNPALKSNTWWSVAGTIDELRKIAEKLDTDGSQAARRLSQRITNSLPRFEATEEKRKRREYRMQQKARFTRPEPGFSMYEGRTRGKRMKYTYSDDEEDYSLSETREGRRSARNIGISSEPVVTASGRHVKPVYRPEIGENSSARASPTTDTSIIYRGQNGRPTRSSTKREGLDESNEQESDAMDEGGAPSSGEEWEGEDEMDDQADVDDDLSNIETEDELLKPKSLVVTLRYDAKLSKGSTSQPQSSLSTSDSHSVHVDPTPNGLSVANITSNAVSSTDKPTIIAVAGESDNTQINTNGAAGTFKHFLYESAGTVSANKTSSARAASNQASTHFHSPDTAVQSLNGHPQTFSASSN